MARWAPEAYDERGTLAYFRVEQLIFPIGTRLAKEMGCVTMRGKRIRRWPCKNSDCSPGRDKNCTATCQTVYWLWGEYLSEQLLKCIENS